MINLLFLSLFTAVSPAISPVIQVKVFPELIANFQPIIVPLANKIIPKTPIPDQIVPTPVTTLRLTNISTTEANIHSISTKFHDGYIQFSMEKAEMVTSLYTSSLHILLSSTSSISGKVLLNMAGQKLDIRVVDIVVKMDRYKLNFGIGSTLANIFKDLFSVYVKPQVEDMTAKIISDVIKLQVAEVTRAMSLTRHTFGNIALDISVDLLGLPAVSSQGGVQIFLGVDKQVTILEEEEHSPSFYDATQFFED